MRNRLLPLFGMAFVAVAANAQSWTAPVPAAYQELQSGQELYLYNVEANAFLTWGNSWTTQISLTNGGSAGSSYLLNDSITIEDGEKVLEKCGWTLLNTDTLFYRGSEKMWGKYVFFDKDSGSGFNDMASQGHNFFEIKKVGDYYRIRAVAADPVFGSGEEARGEDYDFMWMGATLNEETGEPNNALVTTASEDDMIDWAFVSPADFVIWKAKNALYEQLNEALEYGADYSKAEALYNNAAASVEELNEATLQLKEAVAAAKVAALFEGASESDPKDGTALIQNPSFDGNINGWDCTFVSGKTGTNVGYQGASYENGDVHIQNFIEAWSDGGANYNPNYGNRALGDAELCQTIKYLPAGKYSFACDCIAVNQDGDNPVRGVQLYAIGGEVDTYITMATGNNAPEHFELEFIHSGGDITIGLRTRDTNANWIAADNFTLMYYGEMEIDPFQMVLQQTVSHYEEQYPEDELHAQTSVIEEWQAVLEASKALADEYGAGADAYKASKETLDAAAVTLQASISAYKKLASAVNEAREKYAEAEAWPELQGLLGDLMADLQAAYDDGAYDNEQCAAAETAVNELVSDYVSKNAKDGDDVSILISNPNFNTNFSGWITEGGATPGWGGMQNGTNTYGEDENGECIDPAEVIQSGNAEVYHATFDMRQVIKNMPAGLYTLQCQAFERDDAGDGIQTLIYANVAGEEQSVLAKNLHDEWSETMLYSVDNNGNWPDDSAIDGGYVPNSMSGANVYFYKGYYQNKLNILVEEQGDITIGIKCTSAGDWVLFDNFSLIYQGNSAEAWQTTLEDLAAEASALIEANEDNSTIPAQNALEALVDEALNIAEGGDGAKMHDAFLALRAGMAVFQENINAWNEKDNLYDLVLGNGSEYNDIIVEAEGYEDVVAKYEKLAEDVEDVDAFAAMTTEEILQFIADAKAFIEEMHDIACYVSELSRMPEGMDAASDENPVDATGIIVNADLNDGGAENGWNLWGNGGNCVTYANAFGISGNTGVECWNPSGLEFDFNQKLFTLPEGTYTLGAEMANSRNGVASNDHEGRAHLYVEVVMKDGSTELYTSEAVEIQDEGCNDKHGSYSCTFKVPAEYKYVKIGARNFNGIMEWRWFMIDNFTLEYYGKESAKEATRPTAIETVEDVKAETKIYSLNGVEQKRLMKGVNIIKTTMADGTIRVNKILVR